ncbi:SSI family serine proteinase inhibitor [Streptomyces sp. NPDC008121]|uniref:SSI family serine proteinase inhibitor n=1 Tax=Streptomyces sp. NPDC008121 TaxID=3364809 RepID=UPI0036E96D28
MNKILSLAALTLLAASTAGLAHAAPGPGTAELVLSVSAADAGRTEAVLLSCPAGPGAGHVERARACADLAEAGGDFDALHALPRPAGTPACVAGNDPVVATATGTYQGRPVDWTRSYAHTCALQADTASLFLF